MCASGVWPGSIPLLHSKLFKAPAVSCGAILCATRALIPGLLAGALLTACAASGSSPAAQAAQAEAGASTASAATLAARGTSTPSPTPLATAFVITATPLPKPVDNRTATEYLEFASEIHKRQADWIKSIAVSRAKLAQDAKLLTQDSSWSTAYAALLEEGFAIAAAIDSAGVPKVCRAYHEQLQTQAKHLRLGADRLLTFVATMQAFNNGEADDLLSAAIKTSDELQADQLKCK